jgi:cellulose synthase operon protein C
MRKLASPILVASLAAASFTFAAPSPARADNEAIGRATAAVGRGDYALAEKELASVKSGPDRAEAVLQAARIQALTGRYAEAIATAKTAAGLGKDARDEAAAIRGHALAALGKTAEAIAALKEVEGDDGARRARVYLGEVLIQAGRRGDARAPLLTLVDDYNQDKVVHDAAGLSLVGRAMYLLRSPKDAHQAFAEAEEAGGKKIVETLIDEADMYLDKYNPRDAGSCVKDALKIAPRDPDAHVAMARVKLDNSMDFDAAESEVRQALDVNPNHTGAYFVRAGLALRDMDIAAADQAADRGLTVNPNDLELLSMKAAIRFLADDRPGFDAMKQKVLALNPAFSTFYQIVGEFAEWEHRYDDIVTMMDEATKIDKNDGKAFATLGLNLIRAGDETRGVAALRDAWKKDRYNVRVKNTLDILYEDRIPNQYTTVQGPVFNIRYNKEEKAILERYVPRMLEEAWASMVQRYGFTPQTPVGIELYADTESFSIRTSGLPNVGIQGVCFGKTLAAESPSAGPFNWGNVLWHELGHVFAIQMSKNHVPRWFTEGLSEYETIIRRPEWQREEDPALFAALKAGRIPPVDGFNRAFTHVDSVEDVTMAYYAASQIQVFLAQEFGFAKVVSMLPRWGAGERTAEVVKGALGVTPEELDRRFRAWLKPRLVRYTTQYVPDLHTPPLDDARKAARANPNDAKRQVELALALYADGQKPEGDAVLAEALRLDPKQPDAHYVELRLAMREKNVPEAERIVAKMIADGNDGYSVRMKAAQLAEHRKDMAAEKQSLEAANKLDPSQVEPLQGLFDLAHKQGDKAGELSALSRLAQLDQHDRKVWNMLLARLVERGDWEEARKVGESAMFIDVHNWKTHRLYARALARTGRFVSAVYELNSAIICQPKPKDQAEIYGELGKAYDKMGEADLAKQAREYQRQIESAPTVNPPGPPGRHHDDAPEGPPDGT